MRSFFRESNNSFCSLNTPLAVCRGAVFFVVDIIYFLVAPLRAGPGGLRVVGEEKRMSQKLRDVTKIGTPDEENVGIQ